MTIDFPVDDVSEHLTEPGVTIWVDLDASDQGTLDQVARELGIHEIAIENATAGGQRPKIDRYPDHAFLAAGCAQRPGGRRPARSCRQ